MRLQRLSALCTAFLLTLGGCFLDRAGGMTGPAPTDGEAQGLDGAMVLPDGAPLADAAGADSGPPADDAGGDAARDDAGTTPACEHRGRSRSAGGIGRDGFSRGTHDGTVADGRSLALAVQRYAPGAVLFTGYRSRFLNDDAPEVRQLDSSTPAHRALYDNPSQDFGGGDPRGLGVTGGDMSIRVDGEMWLEAGTSTIRLQANDRGALEIDAESGTVTAATVDWEDRDEVTVSASAAGWVSFRAVMENGGGDASIDVQIQPPSSDSFRAFEPTELRVDLADVEGRYALAWDSSTPSGTPDGHRVDTESTTEIYGNTPPDALGLGTSGDNWTVRWYGMHLLAQPGAAIDVDVERRFHLWVDGVYFGRGDRTGTYRPALGPGWHEIVLELRQDGGNDGEVSFTYGESAFSADAMRARSRAGGRVYGAPWASGTNVNPGSRSSTGSLNLDIPSGSPTFIEVSAIVRGPSSENVEIDWLTPTGSTGSAPLSSHGRRLPGTDEWHFRAVVETPDADGSWEVFLDNRSDSTMTLHRAGILAHVDGVQQPYPSGGIWVSEPITLSQDLRIDRLRMMAEQPGGSSVTAEVRGAATAGGLDGATWVPVDASGRVAGSVTGSFVQVRLTLRGGGTVTPHVWDVALFGSPCIECESDRCAPWGDPRVQVLYPLEGSGDAISDESMMSPPLDLQIGDPTAATQSLGSLRISRPTIAEGTMDATRVVHALQATQEVTVEAWVTPAVAEPPEDLPSRIVTLSTDTSDQAFVLGQSSNATATGRIHTTTDSFYETTDPAATLEVGELNHVVFTRAAGGATQLWINGALAATGSIDGDFSGWQDTYRLAIGNERGGGRLWLGAVHMVAIYDQALMSDEIVQHYQIGPNFGL